jgi:hypothetical protein
MLGGPSDFMSAGRLVHLVLVICFWGLVITLYVWWRVRERRNEREGAIERRAIIDRLLRPDWGFYERHLQRPAPAALCELYADQSLITIAGLDFSKNYKISTFNPIDEDGLLNTLDTIGCDIVAFASSDCGDPIYLRPGSTESDMVYIIHHDDPGHVEVFAESVAVMLEGLRHENRAVS